MVPGKRLAVLVEDFVAWTEHDGGTELKRAPTRLLLSVPSGKRANPCDHCIGAQQRRRTQLAGADDLGGPAVLIEQNRKRHLLVFDEGCGVALSARADGGDVCTRGEDLVVSIADLTGPLAAGQSAKMPQEEQHVGLLCPEITETMVGPVGIDEDLFGELNGVERHVAPDGARH